MSKNMTSDEETKPGKGAGKHKNHFNFLLNSMEWSAGKEKSHSSFSMSSKGCTGKEVVLLCALEAVLLPPA